jgi:poly(A) polymerase
VGELTNKLTGHALQGPLAEGAILICKILQANNHQAVIAGGAVRDMILGVEPHDIDIATSATPDEVEALFEHTVAVGKSFGVIRVIVAAPSNLHAKEEYEVATFRTDSKSGDGRRPDNVTFSNMENDALRRDISINGLFYDPIGGKLYDYVNGIKDIENETICMIGNPVERINEDKLRMLRVIRFATRYGWAVDVNTFCAVAAEAAKIVEISKERIAEELTKILTCENAAMGFNLLSLFWPHLIPEIAELDGTRGAQDSKWHPEGNVTSHVHLMLKNAGKKLIGNKVLAWSILLHDIAKPQTFAIIDGRITNRGHADLGAEMAERILTNLRFDAAFVKSVTSIVKNHMKFFVARQMKRSTRLKMIADKDFKNALELHYLDCISSNGNIDSYICFLEEMERTPLYQLFPLKLVDGNDLIALGMKPGAKFREILETIRDEQREGNIATREAALTRMKQLVEAMGIIESTSPVAVQKN